MSAGDDRIVNRLAPYRKAVASLLLGPATATAVALADGAVTSAEWAWIAVAAVAMPGAVYAIPNRTDVVPPPPDAT